MPKAAHSQRDSSRDSGGSVSMDALRALAALLVVVDHIFHLVFIEYWQSPLYAAHPLRTRALFAPFRFGPEAVVVFFVLSGYLVGGSVLRSVERDRWSWREYLTRRLVRLWLVLLPALVLCTGWQCLRQWPPTHAWLVANDVTWTTFFGNVGFLQSIRVENFGGNRVLWTLANEFWYYLLFPLLVLLLRRRESLLLRRRESLLLRGLYALLLVLIVRLVGHAVLSLFPVWLFGALLGWLQLRRRPPVTTARVRWVAVVVYAVAVYWLSVLIWPSRIFKMDYVVGLLTMALLWLLLGWNDQVSPMQPWVRAARWLAGLSYSLYLVHYPLLQFCADHLTHGMTWRPSPSHALVASGVLLITVGYAAVVAAGTERHNDAVRRWVDARLGG